MAKKKRTARETAEAISQKILDKIGDKVTAFDKAKGKSDLEGMWENQISELEFQFLQAQQRLDQDADAIDGELGILNEMPLDELEALFTQVNKNLN